MYDNNDAGGGCMAFLIFAAIICWISDNWTTTLLVIGGILAIVAIIIGIKSYVAGAPQREAAAKAKADKEAEEKLAKEEASYRAYEQAYKESSFLSNKLYTANTIIEKLRKETDEAKRIKILSFFDRYLPVITEIIEASKHGEVDIDDSIERFTETVKSFSCSLYKVDDVVDVNKAMMESMAIMDGFYDPYADSFNLDKDTAAANQKRQEEGVPKQSEPAVKEIKAPNAGMPVEEVPKAAAHKAGEADVILNDMDIRDRLETAILLDDYDEIRDMIDSGEIDEWDLDDEVREKVEAMTW